MPHVSLVLREMGGCARDVSVLMGRSLIRRNPRSRKIGETWGTPGSYSQLKSPIIDTIRGGYDLPPSGLQHVGFVEGADGEAFHRSLQVFADFK